MRAVRPWCSRDGQDPVTARPFSTTSGARPEDCSTATAYKKNSELTSGARRDPLPPAYPADNAPRDASIAHIIDGS